MPMRAARPRGWPPRVQRKKECSFLKKRTKKLLRTGLSLSGEAEAKDKSFLLLFFKKEGLP
jgi:hypothetical protein